MKIRSGTAIAIGFVALFGGGYAVKEVVTNRLVMQERFTPLLPGKVNILGIAPEAGYSIVVANGIAQLVQRSSDFGGDAGDSTGGATEGAIKRRVPIREMLQSLQGDAVALGKFTMAMNDLSENDDSWPAVRIIWTAERIRAALDAPGPERTELERDLNVALDGTPLPRIRMSSYENGIVIDYPVPVQVRMGGATRTVVGRVREPYRPSLLRLVENDVKEKADVTSTMVAGYYQQEARKIESGELRKEDVRAFLEEKLSKSRAASLARKPQSLLASATVVVNDAHVEDARYRAYEDADGRPVYDLTVEVDDEGRRRLWQYSKTRVGTQLLLCSDGIAVAAPRIGHELAQGELTITRMKEKFLVEQAVALFKAGRVNRS